MNKKQLILFSLISLMFTSGIYLWSSIFTDSTSDDESTQFSSNPDLVKTANSIPFDYYQDIEIGKDYIYNVTSFGADSEWNNFSGGKADWKTDTNEQIYINFTGFFDRDTNVPGDTFPDTEMPWINISIFESGALLNYTNVNVSNSEVSRNLGLGFANFQPGFLITVNHTEWIKSNATTEANSVSAQVTIEETYNFLYFRFEQNGIIDNKTELIYDKITGLLVDANITIGNYHLELFWEGYAMDFEVEYVYNINKFGPPGYGFWYDLAYTYKDTYALRTDSWVLVNFTGYYNEDPLDSWDFDAFNDQEKRPWLDIEAVYDGVSGPITTMALSNVSNQEASVQMALGIGSLVSGFLLITINNDSFDLQSSLSANGALLNGKTSIIETDLTTKIKFEHNPGAYLQDTYLIYEKRTGLLLWADTRSGENYHLVMTIDDYIPWTEASSKLSPSDNDDDDDDKEKGEQAIPSFPLIIVFGIISTISLIMILRVKKTLKDL